MEGGEIRKRNTKEDRVERFWQNDNSEKRAENDG